MGGVTRCKSKADEVEALARLLGIHQIKVNSGEGAAVPPRTILPADVFQEVTERIVLKTEPAETLQEQSEASASTPSQVSENLLIARPPRPRPPPPTFQVLRGRTRRFALSSSLRKTEGKSCWKGPLSTPEK